MHGQRTQGGGSALAARLSTALVAAGLAALAPSPAAAAPGDGPGQYGLLLARRHDCVKAVPLLEQAELARHRPSWAVALADCYVATGELLHASELYHVVVDDKPQRFWVRTDYNARKAAHQRAEATDKRIPTLSFSTDAAYDELVVEVDGKPLADPTAEKQIAPDVPVTIAARARGRAELTDEVTLNEGERRVIALHLERLAVGTKKKKKGGSGGQGAGASPTNWLGVRYYGAVIPKFVMNIVAQGGENLVVPGGAFTFTTLTSDLELTVALGYVSYRMGSTPFNGHGEPDNQWELVSSTLQALTATVDLMWSFPLGDSGASFRIGGAAGVGWMFLGDLYRVQAYPPNFKPGVVTPGNPYTYLPCQGPNNPRGTFAYCNELDADGAHYPGYTEPDWFHGGIRPSLFPWLVVPQFGFSFRPASNVAIDVDTGVSLSGILTSVGVRFGL